VDFSLHVRKETIRSVNVVRDLCVVFDEELTTNQHISKMAVFAFHHIQRLRKLQSILGTGITASLVSAFISSRLDYCITVLANLPVSTIAPLQHVRNVAARLIKGPCDAYRQQPIVFVRSRDGLSEHSVLEAT